MVKVIKQGRLRVTCKTCKSLLEYEPVDIRVQMKRPPSCSVDALVPGEDYKFITCPYCNRRVLISEEEK